MNEMQITTSQGNINKIQKALIIDLLKKTYPASFKLLILDAPSFTIINNNISVQELRFTNVASIFKLDDEKKSPIKTPAIYIIDTSENNTNNIKRVYQDIQKNLYADYTILFLYRIGNDQLRKFSMDIGKIRMGNFVSGLYDCFVKYNSLNYFDKIFNSVNFNEENKIENIVESIQCISYQLNSKNKNIHCKDNLKPNLVISTNENIKILAKVKNLLENKHMKNNNLIILSHRLDDLLTPLKFSYRYIDLINELVEFEIDSSKVTINNENENINFYLSNNTDSMNLGESTLNNFFQIFKTEKYDIVLENILKLNKQNKSRVQPDAQKLNKTITIADIKKFNVDNLNNIDLSNNLKLCLEISNEMERKNIDKYKTIIDNSNNNPNYILNNIKSTEELENNPELIDLITSETKVIEKKVNSNILRVVVTLFINNIRNIDNKDDYDVTSLVYTFKQFFNKYKINVSILDKILDIINNDFVNNRNLEKLTNKNLIKKIGRNITNLINFDDDNLEKIIEEIPIVKTVLNVMNNLNLDEIDKFDNIIIFQVGGGTFIENYGLQILSKQISCNIFYGSEHVLNGKSFLEKINEENLIKEYTNMKD